MTPVKPISTFSQRWSQICNRLKEAPVDAYSPERPLTLLVVGAGAGGIELTLSTQYALQKILQSKSSSAHEKSIKIILATRGKDLLPSHNQRTRGIFARILNERNVEVRYQAEATGVCIDLDDCGNKRKSLILSPESAEQSKICFDECLWCTSAGASSWLSEDTPFDTTGEGFIKVKDTYESISHCGVFAAGDCCHMVDNPRPKGKVYFYHVFYTCTVQIFHVLTRVLML